MIPYPYQKNDTDRLLAGKELINPLAVNEANQERGKVAYNRYCINCHGTMADGNGNLFTSGLYAFKPASLINEKMINGSRWGNIPCGLGWTGRDDALWRHCTT